VPRNDFEMIARDVMYAEFLTLRPDHTVAEAVEIFYQPGEDSSRQIFGLMVTYESDRLVGMLSLFDAAGSRPGACRALLAGKIITLGYT